MGISDGGRWWVLIGLYAFTASYSTSLGALVWVLVSEVYLRFGCSLFSAYHAVAISAGIVANVGAVVKAVLVKIVTVGVAAVEAAVEVAVAVAVDVCDAVSLVCYHHHRRFISAQDHNPQNRPDPVPPHHEHLHASHRRCYCREKRKLTCTCVEGKHCTHVGAVVFASTFRIRW